MKSVALLSLILSLSVSCSSTPAETNDENLKPEGEAPASVAAVDAEKKADETASAIEGKPESAPSENLAVPAPETAPAEAAPVAEAAAASPAPEAAVSAQKLVYPTASLVNLRQGPGRSHGVARVAKFGEGISLTGEQKNTWLKTTDGLWISSLFVAESKPSQANDPVVEAPAPKEAAVVEAPAAKEAAVEASAPVEATEAVEEQAPAEAVEEQAAADAPAAPAAE